MKPWMVKNKPIPNGTLVVVTDSSRYNLLEDEDVGEILRPIERETERYEVRVTKDTFPPNLKGDVPKHFDFILFPKEFEVSS